GGHNGPLMNRRRFLVRAAAAGGGLIASRLPLHAAQNGAPAIVIGEARRPRIPFGVQSGDMAGGRAVVWSRTDRPARLGVEYATQESFRGAHRIVGPAALETDDYTARVDLPRLPAGQTIFYRVTFQPLDDHKALSEPVVGHFRTPPHTKRDVSLL